MIKKPAPAFLLGTGNGNRVGPLPLIAIIVVVLAGGGTVAAAGNSMPDSTLYPVKLATEEVQLALTSSDVDKTELNAKFADRRADEIVYLAAKGDVKEVEVTAQRLNTNLENMTQLTGVNVTSDEAGTGGAVTRGTEPVAIAPQTAPVSPTPTETQQALAPMIAAVPSIEPVPTNESTHSTSNGNSAPATSEATKPVGKSSTERGSEHLSTMTLSPRLAKLKQIVTDNYNKRQARLEEAIQKAPANVRPAIRQALLQSQAEYKKALQNLDDAQTSGN